MDITNKYLVGVVNKGVVIMVPPRIPMTHDEALVLAAWLVALATEPTEPFEEVLKQVENI